jgi:hypothetical protein
MVEGDVIDISIFSVVIKDPSPSILMDWEL